MLNFPHHRALLSLLILLLSCLSGWAQPAQPPPEPPEVSPRSRVVIANSRRDGLLLGLNFSLSLGDWKPEVGGAYGLSSRAVRFTTGLAYREALELSYGDWPSSLVRGREGEEGLHLSADLIALYRWLGGREAGLLGEIIRKSELRATGLIGQLWPGPQAEGPAVRYLHLGSSLHWPLLLDAALETRGEFLVGEPTDIPERSFQTFFSSTRLQAGQTSLLFKMGSLENPAGLAGFQFDLGLRSYPASFKGDRFLLATLEQRYDALSAHLFWLDLTRILGPQLGSIPVRLHVITSVFFEGGVVFEADANPNGHDGSGKVLFGWGISLIAPDLVRIDVAVNREGEPVLTVKSGVLP